MSARRKEFKIKLKNCKSLEDYRLLSEEYNMESERGCPKYREHLIRQRIREKINSLQIF
tara:strand:- start:345 stop:521 length:177 start_codon:yes stop_codon:yes gene_type:complete